MACAAAHCNFNAPKRLPQEVIDTIIDNVDDGDTLKSCSLTCRAWLYRSRFHIHHCVTIGPVPGIESETAYDNDIDIIAERYSSLASCVRTLGISQVAQLYEGAGPREDQALATLALFPNIRTLVFWGALWTEERLSAKTKDFICSHFSQVTSMTLTSRTTFSNGGDLVIFLSRFQRLSHLTLDVEFSHGAYDDVTLASLRDGLMRQEAPRPPLCSLIDVGRNTGNWLAAALIANWYTIGPIGTLKSLQCSVGSGTKSDAKRVSELLHAMGPCLEDLLLDFRCYSEMSKDHLEILAEANILASNTRLRSLRLRFHVACRPVFKRISLLLAQIASSDLSTISFEFIYLAGSHEDIIDKDLDLSDVDKLLSTPRFEKLKSLHFLVSDGPTKSLRNLLSQRMTLTRTTGHCQIVIARRPPWRAQTARLLACQCWRDYCRYSGLRVRLENDWDYFAE